MSKGLPGVAISPSSVWRSATTPASGALIDVKLRLVVAWPRLALAAFICASAAR